jgi:hypothetical protein
MSRGKIVIVAIALIAWRGWGHGHRARAVAAASRSAVCRVLRADQQRRRRPGSTSRTVIHAHRSERETGVPSCSSHAPRGPRSRHRRSIPRPRCERSAMVQRSSACRASRSWALRGRRRIFTSRRHRVFVNLAGAELIKKGTAFDLAIACLGCPTGPVAPLVSELSPW